MRTLIVDAQHVAAVQQAFPGTPVIGARGSEDFAAQHAEQLRGLEVILWCHGAQLIAEDLADIASRIGMVNGDRWPAGLSAPQIVAYARAHVRPWQRPSQPGERAVASPVASGSMEGGDPNGVASPPVGVPPAPAGATVTPITEARQRQQAKLALEPVDLPPKYSHDALTLAFTQAHPDWRYVAQWGKWLHCVTTPEGGCTWKHDVTTSVFNLARRVCREQALLASIDGNITPAAQRAIVDKKAITATEFLARSAPEHARPADIWDADPWLLNTTNGIINLKDGSFRPARPEDHCTRITSAAFDPCAMCPNWMVFLAQATRSDAEMMAFLQRMAGCMLTGITRDHPLFFIYGQGGNGKGTFLNTLTWLLGDYAGVVDTEAFTEHKNERHSTDIASLNGRRMVSAQEVAEGARWNEPLLNKLTGGDPITARFMRCDPFTYQPQFKLIIVGNHKPLFRNVGDAIRRRLYLIPFDHKPQAPDVHLSERLRGEGPGILRWALAGCQQWQECGLDAPECVRLATADYLGSQDTLGAWIAQRLEPAPITSEVAPIYRDYSSWIETEMQEQPLGRKRWRMALEAHGITIVSERKHDYIKGLRLKPETPVLL